MGCTNPLIRVEFKSKTKKGLLIEKYSTSKYRRLVGMKDFMEYKRIDKIPCGHCYGCILDRKSNWATRIVLEAKSYPEEYNWFITLTYDDDHITETYRPVLDIKTGELTYKPNLIKKDVQLFMKRLRKQFDEKGHQGIKLYACGEYGPKNLRPHFHICLFNLPLDMKKLKLIRKAGAGIDALWISEEIEKAWDKGFHTVGQLTYNSAAYTAGYVDKKANKDNLILTSLGYEAEFTLCSRRPGIGNKYYQDHKEEIYSLDQITIKTRYGIVTKKPSAYYDHLYDLEQPELLEEIKKKRQKLAQRQEKNSLKKTSISLEEQLQIKERTYKDKNQKLRRDRIQNF